MSGDVMKKFDIDANKPEVVLWPDVDARRRRSVK
jgi:hypothetical protein